MNTTATTAPAPEWVRLPAAGKRSPKLGLSRATIYRLAKEGHVRLAKGILKPGHRRGVTFVDRVSLKAYLASAPTHPATTN